MNGLPSCILGWKSATSEKSRKEDKEEKSPVAIISQLLTGRDRILSIDRIRFLLFEVLFFKHTISFWLLSGMEQNWGYSLDQSYNLS